MSKSSTFVGIFGLAVGVGVIATLIPAAKADSTLEVIKVYKKWHLVTKEPVDMSPAMAFLCSLPPKRFSSPNPHVAMVYLVYVNNIGEKQMPSQESRQFPNGTVIVKEKYARTDFQNVNGKLDISKLNNKQPEFTTIMIKTNDKWDYFALSSKGELATIDRLTCQNCHEEANKSDFVFTLSNLGHH